MGQTIDQTEQTLGLDDCPDQLLERVEKSYKIYI